MSFKQDKYYAKDEIDEFGMLTEKLAADLRKSIRQLENFPILSIAWFEMAEVFGRIANISDMESKLPSAKDDATLWETEEQALRFLLEDGKLNLCLRNLIDFKQMQIVTRKTGTGQMTEFASECDKFEKGVGTIMKNAWLHVEVLQTTDLPALLNHIADVLKAAVDLPKVTESLVAQGDIHQRQEVMVFYYLFGVLKHIDDIGEHRVLPIIRERGIFMLAVRLLTVIGGCLLKVHKLKAAEALSLLVETEDFSTYKSQYYSGSDIDILSQFKDVFLSPLLTEFENRKFVRPIVDCVDKAKRSARK